MASKYWIKLYHEILDDPKMGRMPDRLWRRTIELFLIAGETHMNGVLPRLEEMAYRLRLEDDELKKDLDYLVEKGVVRIEGIQYIVTKFAERQAAMTDAERMRRYRDSKQKDQYYGNDDVTNTVTDCNVEVDKIRKEKKRKEEIPEARSDYSNFQSVWEQETGRLITPREYKDFQSMCERFERVGVTPEVYRKAIKEQQQSEYPVKRPSGVEEWTMRMIANDKGMGGLKKKQYIGPNGEVIEV